MSTVEHVRPAPVHRRRSHSAACAVARTRRGRSERPLVAEPGDHSGDPHVVRRLLDLGGLPEPQLLRRGRRAPQPDLAVLLALPGRELRTRQPPRFHPGAVDDLARHLDTDRPARVQAHLLLLPPRVLPGVLAVAPGLRRRPTHTVTYSGESRVPADHPERRTATSSTWAWS